MARKPCLYRSETVAFKGASLSRLCSTPPKSDLIPLVQFERVELNVRF